jgi:Zn finger protein HypA/HybF involved in hydrogenase expression
VHEAAMCEGILSVVLEVAQERPVKRVQLVLGERQGIVRDSFDFYWEMMTTDTTAAGSVVESTESEGEEIVIVEIELDGGEVRRNPALIEIPEHEH